MPEPYTLHLGDCLLVLPSLPDNSVDAVVTDPPYGLSFMGKNWDHGVPGEQFWREVLRVAKPGAHLLAFGGTRTYHRLACAIEDAGWEIRDCVMWVYGCLSEDTEVLTQDGWERYHKARHKEILAYDSEADVYQWERPSRWSEYRVESDTAYRIESDQTDQIVSRNHRCLVERGGVLAFVAAEECSGVERVPYLQGDVSALPQGRGELLLAGVLRQGEGLAQETLCERQGQEVSSQGDGRGEESGMERRADILQAEGQVRRPVDQVCSLPGSVHGHGSEGWLRHGASAYCGDGDGEAAVAERVRASRQSRCDGQSAGEPDAVCVERGPQAARTRPTYQTTLATVTPIEYSGVIFCPTVSTGAFVARRNGKVFVTGNSGFPKSHDVSKAIDKAAGRIGHATGSIKDALRDAHAKSGRTLTQLNDACGFEASGYLRASSTWANVLPPSDKWPILRDALELSSDMDALFQEAEREVVGERKKLQSYGAGVNDVYGDGPNKGGVQLITAPSTEAAKQWAGWGTALKPAYEPVLLCRKPLQGTVAENVLRYGTGGINVDGCKVGTTNDGAERSNTPGSGRMKIGGGLAGTDTFSRSNPTGPLDPNQGRWPANLLHSGEPEVVGLFPVTTSGSRHLIGHEKPKGSTSFGGSDKQIFNGDTGSAARFFQACPDTDPEDAQARLVYCAKASKRDRDEGCEGMDARTAGECTDRADGSDGLNSPRAGAGRTSGSRNHHPTVKPTSLMRYLVRLITPPGGVVLDPFMGSGSTGKACGLEGFQFIGIEQSPEYMPIASARVAFGYGTPAPMPEPTPAPPEPAQEGQLSLF